MTEGIRWQRSGILAAALLLVAPSAFACSIVHQAMSRAQVESYARTQVSEASAIVDAEVETPMDFGPGFKSGLLPVATLRVIKHHKGVRSIGDDIVPLVYFFGCDIALLRKGERVRILLKGGPDLFRADLLSNGAPSTRDSQSEFNAEIDRLVKAPRPAGFSAYPGEIEPPVDTATEPRDRDPAKKPASKAAQMATASTSYGLWAFGALLAFLAGFLIGRRRRTPRTDA